MTRDQFRRMWLLIGVCLLLAASYAHGTASHWLERLAITDVGALLFWEMVKDR